MLYAIGVAVTTRIISLGGLRHIEYVSPSNLAVILKLQFVNQPMGVMAAFFGKSSVAIFLVRLLGQMAKWTRFYLLCNVALYFVTCVLCIGILYGQCSPTKALWEPQLIATGQARCWNAQVNVGTSSLQGGEYYEYGSFKLY